ELENAVERAVLLVEGTEVTVQSLPERLWAERTAPAASLPGDVHDLSLKRAMRQLEESYIRAALRRTKGNRTRAAELLEISHRALLYKIKDYGIDPDAEGSAPESK
ncbi:MAG TPA: helix-turn-helix domain-containing protein, partial [Planctomycetota bacterium]|nr:helix-turn-helix domain-containing protein [Planctomycetota bacterium]